VLGQGIFLALDLRHTADSLIDRQLLFAVVLRLDIVLHCAERQPLIGLLAGFLLDGFFGNLKIRVFGHHSQKHFTFCTLRIAGFFQCGCTCDDRTLGKIIGKQRMCIHRRTLLSALGATRMFLHYFIAFLPSTLWPYCSRSTLPYNGRVLELFRT